MTKICSLIKENEDKTLCLTLQSMFDAYSLVGGDALFLLNRISREFILAKIWSPSIKQIFEPETLLRCIERSEVYQLIFSPHNNAWDLTSTLYSSRLSANICIDEKRSFFVNLQVIPVKINGKEIQYIFCVLGFSVYKAPNIKLIDFEKGIVWRFDRKTKLFNRGSNPILTTQELEMIRLSKIERKEAVIAQMMNYSRDTIKWYRRKVFEKLGVSTIGEAIHFCETHHII